MTDFLNLHKERLESIGFWEEGYKETLMNCYLSRYNTDIIRNFKILDLLIKENKILVKWIKRYEPLTDEELKERWGRTE